MTKNYSAIYNDFESTEDRMGPTVVCEDWSMAYDWIEDNFNEWCYHRSGLAPEYCVNPVWSQPFFKSYATKMILYFYIEYH